MQKPTRRVLLLVVGLAVVGIAGSAAAASLVAPAALNHTASSNALLGAEAGANPDTHIATPPPTPMGHSGGCHHGWWG